ncbi:hypothetical protein [Xylanimonas allomyrinae]|uniref:hypothetical protein n=1 Tax=Xylanimonas allomyrinae TaxID=2509459 RepID=UPI001FE9AA61|nr:hypothetical protein [Xylanimonas allomyrinae]
MRPARDVRPERERVVEPEIAEDVSFRQLAKDARERLRGLNKENAERVGEHLVMAGRLLDVDPELAYEHTQAAVRRGGRIDVVREAAGIAAYRTGRFAEALRELRTVRRLNGSSEHLPIMADAERGLGRPERAIALAASPEADELDPAGRVELALVVSGARSDLGEHDAALAVLDKIPPQRGDLGLRVLAARSAVLEAAGRDEEAAAVLAGVDPEDLERATGNAMPEEDVVVYDVYDETLEEEAPASDAGGGAESGAGDESDAESGGDRASADESDEAGAPADAPSGRRDSGDESDTGHADRREPGVEPAGDLGPDDVRGVETDSPEPEAGGVGSEGDGEEREGDLS